jgi:hypothetical protein
MSYNIVIKVVPSESMSVRMQAKRRLKDTFAYHSRDINESIITKKYVFVASWATDEASERVEV